MAATTADQRAFIDNAVGKFFDPDGMYGFQCKDVIDAYCLALWNDWRNTIRPGNANEIWSRFNPVYFDRIPNVVGDLTNYPKYGDVVITAGDSINRFGHIFICVSADAYKMLALQQNVGGQANRPAELGTLLYDQPGTGPVIGWLRPKVTPSVPAGYVPPPGWNGIDISEHQKGIDIAGTGAKFCIMKATEGGSYRDKGFDINLQNLRASKIQGGFYHFAHPWHYDGNSPSVEANYFLSVIGPHYRPGDIIALDWEDPNSKLSDAAWALDFMKYVRAALGVSMDKSWFYTYTNILNTNDLSAVADAGYPLWLANYPTSNPQSWGPVREFPKPPGNWKIAAWQYSSTGRLPGYAGNLDLNIAYNLEDDIMATEEQMKDFARVLLNYPAFSPTKDILKPPTVSEALLHSEQVYRGLYLGGESTPNKESLIKFFELILNRVNAIAGGPAVEQPADPVAIAGSVG